MYIQGSKLKYWGDYMDSNPALSTVVGIVIVGVGAGLLWGLLFGLEFLAGLVTNKNLMGAIIAAPMVGFIAYLVGDGFLQNRSRSRGGKS